MSITRNLLRTIVSTRQFHLSSRLNIDPKTVEEVRIPVPWGHVAGKRWGDKTSQPIIALHGQLDSSSSFDKLLPLIDAPSVLCLDITGHGLSSHTPKGLSIYFTDNIIRLRYILKYFYKWEKDLIFLGHSFGSSILFNYAAIYPDEVSKMINIDCARFRSAINVKKFVQKTKESIEHFLNSEKHHDTIESGYSFEDCVNHMMATRASLNLAVSEEGCRILCSRGASNMGNGKYYFTHDRRSKEPSFNRNTPQFNLALAGNIKCSVLNIHATGGINIKNYEAEENKQIKIMKENAKYCENLILEGTHHIHLETPEVVAPHINKFLKS
ncbi:hypothetical protein O3M35_006780 [Rhynocoris fuscipes]|uniref:AB hydrolase-1 domain-containing protein n=1 Tax=Rhynocoris fuscipes TaxID=488301 RepID=A0AAW1DIE8_9HEMI